LSNQAQPGIFKGKIKTRFNHSAAQPQPKRSAGLPTRSRREGKTGLASPQSLERAEPLRLGPAAVRRLRKVCASWQTFRQSNTKSSTAGGTGLGGWTCFPSAEFWRTQRERLSVSSQSLCFDPACQTSSSYPQNHRRRGGWLGRLDLCSKRRVVEDTEGEALCVLPFSVLNPACQTPPSHPRREGAATKPERGSPDPQPGRRQDGSPGKAAASWGQPRSGGSEKFAWPGKIFGAVVRIHTDVGASYRWLISFGCGHRPRQVHSWFGKLQAAR
jgi:hypothetical protein